MSEPQTEERIYKTPVYIRNAKNKYYNRKMQTDPEYAENVRLKTREWRMKKLEEDPEMREREKQRNLEYSRKKNEQKWKDFINGEELLNLVNQAKLRFNSLATINITPVVRNTLLSNSGNSESEKPLFLKLKEQKNRPIKTICVSAILYVALLIEAGVSIDMFAKCYRVNKQSIQDVVLELNQLQSPAKVSI